MTDENTLDFVNELQAYMVRVIELQTENEQLRHDLERQMTIANEHVNEVERLRAEAQAQYDRGYYDGRKMDATEERAKIVAWLWGMGLHNINDIADQIEAGEHLK